MKVTARLFASLRTTAGRSQVVLDVPEGSTVRKVAAALEQEVAGLRLDGVLVAVNEEYAAPDAPVAAGDEIAFLPPVSGG